MNAEISKLRKSRNYDVEMDIEPTRIKPDRLDEMIFQLNSNMRELYNTIRDPYNVDIDLKLFTNRLIENIYIILNGFNEMGVYPDYFYDELVKLKIEKDKLISGNKNAEENYKLRKEIEETIQLKTAKIMENGMNNKYYHFKAYQEKNIDDNYDELVKYYQALNLPYGVSSKESVIKNFTRIFIEQVNATEKLLNTYSIHQDIYCFTQLLISYMSFFAAIGIRPKNELNSCIESVDNIKHK